MVLNTEKAAINLLKKKYCLNELKAKKVLKKYKAETNNSIGINFVKSISTESILKANGQFLDFYNWFANNKSQILSGL